MVLAALDDAEASVGEPTGTPRGVLRLNLPDAFGRIEVLPLLRSYLDAWPDVQVEISFTDQVTDLVEGASTWPCGSAAQPSTPLHRADDRGRPCHPLRRAVLSRLPWGAGDDRTTWQS
ncbi:hypothetical protein ACFQU7_41605 [Pseudoroseomonas wenyumeiae]